MALDEAKIPEPSQAPDYIPKMNAVFECTEARPETGNDQRPVSIVVEAKVVEAQKGRPDLDPPIGDPTDGTLRFFFNIGSDDDPKGEKDDTWYNSKGLPHLRKLRDAMGVSEAIDPQKMANGYYAPTLLLSQLKGRKFGCTTRQYHNNKGFVNTTYKEFWKPGLNKVGIADDQLHNRPQTDANSSAAATDPGRKQFQD